MNTRTNFLSLATLLAAAGCQTTTPTPTAATETPTPPPTTSPAVPADTFYTAASSLHAGQAVADVFWEEFRFATLDAHGQYTQPRTVNRQDYFFSNIDVETAEGVRINVTCRWVSDVQTEVTIRADLPPAQRQVILKHVRQAVDAPALPNH